MSGRGGSSRRQRICFEFRDTGSCRFGSSCRYQHFVGGSGRSQSSHSLSFQRGRGGGGGRGGNRRGAHSPSRSRQDVCRFIQHVSRIPYEKLGSELSSKSELWLKCWTEHASLTKDTRRLMVQVLARIPGSSSVDPPPIDVCEPAIQHFLQEQATASSGEDVVLTAVKTGLGALKRLIDFEWKGCSREQVKGGLSRLAILAEAKLRKQFQPHREVATELMQQLEYMEKPWRIRMKESATMQEERELGSTFEEEESYLAWQSPTIRWLKNPTFFAPSCVPVMKVGPQEGVYESAEDYMNTVMKLWVAMSFSDGHSAVAPVCRGKGNRGTICGKVLWPVASGASGRSRSLDHLRCRRNCSRPVEVCCSIGRSHDALCGPCASHSADRRVGEPGHLASTHIYDCKVEHIDPDGFIFFTDFKSRRPPEKPIHWRSTKRLSTPNLVGVVQTGARGAPLVDTDRIKWGEVVFHDGPRDEWRRRENGQLKINLSSIVEFDPDHFREGASVVVVDCMTFVPEWIPALRALESMSRARLPFEDGKYLNLWREDRVSGVTVLERSSIEEVTQVENTTLVRTMVEESQLEPIREIRRIPENRDSLITQLRDLVEKTTLDRMQLISFLDSLRNPVHLTQGPPGTGKSYLGVVLVRALMIVRKLWLKTSKSVGASPILVLSYKNHAIDEFLVDLVNAEAGGSCRRLSLVRIGGQCKDSRLSAYSERSAHEQDAGVTKARKLLEQLQDLRESIGATQGGKAASFLSYQHCMFYGADDSGRRKAAYEATGILMQSIVRRRLLKQAIARLEEKQQCSSAEVASVLAFLGLQSDDEPSPAVKRHMNASDGSSFIMQLQNEVHHYSDLDHWAEVLLMWISGKKPRPLCKFSGSKCPNLSISPDLPLCEVHRCSFHGPSSDDTRCTLSCFRENSQFCEEHCCRAEDCNLGRLPGDQKYCPDHACRRCLVLSNGSANLAIDDPPRNVCEDHPMCLEISCLQFCDADQLYCTDHSEIKCRAITKKKKPCKGKAIDRSFPYCQDHVYLARMTQFEDGVDDLDIEEPIKPAVPRSRTSHFPTKCAAVTKRGKPCKGVRLQGSLFCYDHNPELLSCGELLGRHQTTPVSSSTSAPYLCATDTRSEEENSETKSSKTLEDDQNSDSSDSFRSAVEEEMAPEPDGTLPVDADEQEWEDEEGDHMRHLRDVFEVDNDSDTESRTDAPFSEQGDPDSASDNTAEDAVQIVETSDWNWEMSVNDRWEACNLLMEDMLQDLRTAAQYTKNAIVLARKEHQKAKTRAKARVYENKTVIGGTMVGCIARLDPIRASRPFAIVIEEASEVLEPLLFSCLSESTLKLEMIGDHRQLQPNVMDRFDFERRNKVNISMFQRLIEAPPGHEVPSTVLSVQRRMRRNICDLTRDFYADVTQIEDHDICTSQTVAGRLPLSGRKLVSSSATSGREIPGIGPHLFIWTHDGKQSRADVGVSRVNKQEALMTCSLVGYLVQCGVPRQSIAILTPYKGQLMLMRKILLSDPNLVSLRLISKNPTHTDVCRLSTVDRFQGDEEDIVICSLVVDENSNTAFVKLANRMIVLLSRARIGLYIIGNVGYFDTNMPPHWAQTFHKMELPAESDSSALVQSSDTYSRRRTGSELPLCCPVHRHKTFQASSSVDLRLDFCDEVCQSELACGHPCSLRCHWPKGKHNKSCSLRIDSPCGRHPGSLQCHKVFQHSSTAPFGTKHDDILQHYRCPQVVELKLACGHVQLLPCWEENQVVSGARPWPSCGKPSPIPYTIPSCGHTLAVSCSELDQFRRNPTLVQKCKRDVAFTPSCGHRVSTMKCFEKELYESDQSAYSCPETVKTALPRCGHEHSLRCGIARKIADWKGRHCEVIGQVKENQSYGSEDYPCNKSATLSRPCGHDINLPCSEAFARATTLSPCREPVQAVNPSCGHPCKLPCSDFQALSLNVIPTPVGRVREGTTVHRQSSSAGIFPQCNVSVRLERKCGHVERITCYKANKPLTKCRIDVSVQSPLCGHELLVPCGLQNDAEEKLWPNEAIKNIRGGQGISRDFVSEFDSGSLSPDMERALVRCKLARMVELACGHKKEVKCSSLPHILQPSNYLATECNEEVNFDLRCGHHATTTCSLKQSYQSGQTDMVCRGVSARKCWNYASCGRTLNVTCGFIGIASCSETSEWRCPSRNHRFEIPQCVAGQPNQCPGCSMERLNSAIRSPLAFDEDKFIRSYLKVTPIDSIQWLLSEERVEKFFATERALLVRYKTLLETVDCWDRPIFDLKRIPCFRILKDKKRALTDFLPRAFVAAKTFHGLLINVLTARNLTVLSKTIPQGFPVTLLIGFVSVCKTELLHKEVKHRRRGPLAKRLCANSFDSVLFTENGFQRLVAWDPFPLIAVCKVELSNENLLEIASQLTATELPDLAPISIKHIGPPDGSPTTFPLCMADDEDNSSVETTTTQDFSTLLHGTVLAGATFNSRWTGGIASGGALKDSLESDLTRKMQFATPEAAPFAATKQIRTLMERDANPLLFLLMACEMLNHDTDEAKKWLGKYLTHSAPAPLHPWSLIVGARVDPSSSRKLLSTYVKYFPSLDKYLTEDERLDCENDDTESDTSEAVESDDILGNMWEDFKAKHPNETRSEAMEKLLKLVGLRKVKREAMNLWKSALQLRMLDDDEVRKKNAVAANYVFVGNPGTGKTSVARLFADILYDCGLRRENTFVQMTAQEAKDGGSDEFRNKASKATGGVLFIDEAYDLDPVGDFKGRPIVSELLTLCEDSRDTISVILAGYEDDLQKKFFAYNEGLKSRFLEIPFEDFDEREIASIWTATRRDRFWDEAHGVCSVIAKRIAKMSGRKGFGNAREVRKRFESATKSAMNRLGDKFSSQTMVLEIEDVIGKDPRLESEKLRQVAAELENQIGWERIKKSVNDLLDLCSTNYTRELLGQRPFDVSLNRLFLGNPGTGKTTCAKLYGRLLKELCFLSNGEVVCKSGSDFVGSVVGESQTKTSQIIDGARGKVLVIDEAYVLDDGLYGKQVLDTIVEKVQGTPADDIAVLLLGYEAPMLKMIKDQNPGLARRFPPDYAFYFDDFDDKELLAILDLKLTSYDTKCSIEFKEKALDILRTQRQQSNFGNAGAVDLLVKVATEKAAKRMQGAADKIFWNHSTFQLLESLLGRRTKIRCSA